MERAVHLVDLLGAMNQERNSFRPSCEGIIRQDPRRPAYEPAEPDLAAVKVSWAKAHPGVPSGETHIDTNHIARSFPLTQEIDANAAPAFSAKAVDLFPCGKLVTLHVVPPRDPFDILALREDGQITVALTDAAVATLHWQVPTFLLSQVWVGESEAHGTLLSQLVEDT